MYPQSNTYKPATAADALRNPTQRRQVRRPGSVAPMGGGAGVSPRPMPNSPYPHAPRPMQPQRPQGVPAGTQLSMQQPTRPAMPPTTTPYAPTTAVQALQPPAHVDLVRQQSEVDMKVAQIPADQLNAVMSQASQAAMNGDPQAQMIIAALIKRLQSLQNTGTPQPYTPNPNINNQSAY